MSAVFPKGLVMAWAAVQPRSTVLGWTQKNLVSVHVQPWEPLQSQYVQQLFKEPVFDIDIKGIVNHLWFGITATLCLKAEVSTRVVQKLFLLLQTKKPLIPNKWLHPLSMPACLNMELLVSIYFHCPKKEELLFPFFFFNVNGELFSPLDRGTSLFSQEIILLSLCTILALLPQQKYSFRIFWLCPLGEHHHQLFSRCFHLS